MAVWYQLGPSPAPALPEGWSVRPPEVAGVALWRGADNFPCRLEAMGLPLWLVVGALLPWFKAGLDPPPWGVGCTSPSGPVATSSRGWPRWQRPTTRAGFWHLRYRFTLEARDVMDQSLLDQPPVVVTTSAYPSCEPVEAPEILPCDLVEEVGHIGYILEWSQLFEVNPLFFPLGHNCYELHDGCLPSLFLQRPDLLGPAATYEVNEVLFHPKAT